VPDQKSCLLNPMIVFPTSEPFSKLSIIKDDIDKINIPDEYLKLMVQGLRNNLEYVSVVAKDVDRFNKNEEQQDKIKDTLQYPKAEMHEVIGGHVNLFISLFKKLIKIEHSAAYQEFSTWTNQR
jgi:hypothetical protein